MAKDSILVGAVESSGFKNGGTESTLAGKKNGVAGHASRTKSPNAQNEVTLVDSARLQSPTKE